VIVITGRDLAAEDKLRMSAPLATLVHKNATGDGSRPLVVDYALRFLPQPAACETGPHGSEA
jgi:hypothetical protein